MAGIIGICNYCLGSIVYIGEEENKIEQFKQEAKKHSSICEKNTNNKGDK